MLSYKASTSHFWRPSERISFPVFRSHSEFVAGCEVEFSAVWNAYLLLNVTLGETRDWQAVTENGAAPPAFSERGEWVDLAYSNGALVLSVTLCYSAFNTADIPVHISSPQNRTEPGPTYDLDQGQFHFDDIRK